jgi:hypothetical protein
VFTDQWVMGIETATAVHSSVVESVQRESLELGLASVLPRQRLRTSSEHPSSAINSKDAGQRVTKGLLPSNCDI